MSTCSSASPKNRTLLAFHVNQGISASFSLTLQTTRFRSIKEPIALKQQVPSKYSKALEYLLGTCCLRAIGSLMDRNLVVWRVREKEADIPWFTWKANRVLFLGLALLHVDTVRLL